MNKSMLNKVLILIVLSMGYTMHAHNETTLVANSSAIKSAVNAQINGNLS